MASDIRNPQAVVGSYQTALDPIDEMEYRGWVKKNNVPVDPNDKNSDYDMRGYYRALKSGDQRAAQSLNMNDGKMHFPDTWKTPSHASFSRESMYATPSAPSWNEKDQLINPLGSVVFDERKQPKPAPFLGPDATILSNQQPVKRYRLP